jgi:acetyl esterase/lipase
LNAVALAVATLALAVAMWTVLPAPNLLLLALAVLVPELAPWVFGACVLAAIVAYAGARGRARTAALTIVAVAAACALLPIVEFPLARAAADRELAAQLGSDNQLAGEAVLQPIAIRRDLPVTLRDGTRLALDVYAPLGGGRHPAIVTIYGGGWIFGNRAQMAGVDRDYAARGYTAVAIDYRHAPAFHFPTQIHDVDDALGAIAKHARAWNVDPTRVALFGRSAGAELALLAAYAPQPLGIRAVVAYYAPAELTEGFDRPPVPDPAHVRNLLQTYIGATPSEAPDAYRRASPLAYVRPHLPPTLLIGGNRDELVAITFQRELRDALRARGDRVVAIEIPWSNHAFDEVHRGLGTSIATRATREFLASLVR